MGQSKNVHLEHQEKLYYKTQASDTNRESVLAILERISKHFDNQSNTLGRMIDSLDDSIQTPEK